MTSERGETAGPGVLYTVATPVGNREDITLRALDVLRSVDLVAAEDTRHTGRLLEHHGVRGPRLLSYHKFNERQRTPRIVGALLTGSSVALVSNAGTPGISDPGGVLVRAAVAAGIRVSPVPGPSAVAAALSASGLDCDRFVFLGFPPRKSGPRAALLDALAGDPATSVWYESPQRIVAFLESLAERWGDREAVVCRELTKRYEEFLRGPLSLLARTLGEREEIRGEITLLVAGASPETDVPMEAVHREIRLRLGRPGGDTKSVAAAVARAFGLSKKAAYEEVLKVEGKK